MKIYLAAQYSQKEEMRGYANILRGLGIEVTSRWLEEPHKPNTQMHEVTEEELAEYAKNDMQDVYVADLLVFFSQPSTTPVARGGRHVEFGMALAFGMPILVVGPKENIFHLMKYVRHVDTFDDAIPLIVTEEAIAL